MVLSARLGCGLKNKTKVIFTVNLSKADFFFPQLVSDISACLLHLFFFFFFFLFRGTGRQERFLTRREMLRSSQKTWSRHPVTSPVLFCQLGARCWLMHSHTHTLYTHYTRIFLSPKRSESMVPGGSVCKGELKR